MRVLGAGAIAAAIFALAACSSLSLPTAAKLRALDYLNDDVASLLLAFDVPEALEPIPDASTISFDIVSAASGQKHVKAVLVRSEAGEIAGSLPPPADGRTYYLFGFAPADQKAIRDAQAWGRALPQTGTSGNSLAVAISPRFCRTEPVNAKNVRLSVLIALPGATALEPLIANETLANVILAGGGGDTELPACEGHSG
jgi:hypothetical protein